MSPNSRNSGFTLVEILAVLGIIAALGATITPFVMQTLNTKRQTDTVEELKELKKAIIGDPEIVSREVRTSFGYIGDMGSLPPTLEDLYVKGTQPAFTFDIVKKTGAGWNGPYIDPSLVENLASLKKDAYGNDYAYSTTEFTDSTVGATVSAKVVSNGEDGATGGGDDLTIHVFKPEAFSTVTGFIIDSNNTRKSGVSVTINYPSAGTLTTSVTTTDSLGRYTFNNIPYGDRSLLISGKYFAIRVERPVTQVPDLKTLASGDVIIDRDF